MKIRPMHGTSALILVVAALFVAACGGSRKTPDLIPGTRSAGLPPLPADLAAQVYRADALFSKRCIDVPSGMNNCVDWLRNEADRILLEVIGSEITRARSGPESAASRGTAEDGLMEENRTIVDELVRASRAHIALRKLESPVFELADGKTLALRVLVVREEADFELFSELERLARDAGRVSVADQLNDRLEARYKKGHPQTEQIEVVERRVSEHFQEMWEMTARDRKQKKKG